MQIYGQWGMVNGQIEITWVFEHFFGIEEEICFSSGDFPIITW